MKKFILPIIFLVLTLFAHPLMFLRAFDISNEVGYWSIFEFTNFDFLGILSLVFCLFSIKRLIGFAKNHRYLSYFVQAWLIMGILQQIFIFYSPINFFGTISYVTIPLFIYLYREDFKKLFPYYLLFIFVYAIAIYTSEYIYNPERISGIAGNWNWSATIFTISSLSLFYFVKNDKKNLCKIPVNYLLLATLLILLVAVHFIANNPKGTMVAIVVTFGLLTTIQLSRYLSKKTLTLIIFGTLLIIGILVWIFSAKLASFASDDVRLYLWDGGFKVWLLNPILGCGYNYFNSNIIPLLSEAYHTSKHVALLHPHPHNEFIFLLASFGLMGWLYCLGVVSLLIAQIRVAVKSKTLLNYLNLAIFVIFVIHGMFDIVLFMWPGNVIFLIVLGLILPTKKQEEAFEVKKSQRNISYMVAVIILIITLFFLYQNTRSSYYQREYYLTSPQNNAKRLENLEKSFQAYVTPKNLYLLANIYYQKMEIKHAIQLLIDMPKLTNFENYQHNHRILATSYMMENKPNLAFTEFEKEYINYPLSTINLVFFERALREANQIETANTVNQLLIKSLKLKNLTTKDIRLIFDNPDYDIFYRKIPPKL